MMQEDDNVGWYWHGTMPPTQLPTRMWPENPYEHRYLPDGSVWCDSDCDACHWNQLHALKHMEERADLSLPRLTAADVQFLKEMQITW